MKRVEIVTKTSIEVNIDGKPVSELLSDIAKLCHEGIEYSSSKEEGCEMLYEDNEYEDYRNDMENRVSFLEGILYKILEELGD